MLGYRTIDVGARLLAVLMVAEIGILLVLDIAVLAAKGGAALPATSFAPHTLLHGGGSLGIGLMFAFGAYAGFESAALYGEEARNPRRSIPLATYASVLVITVFYGLTSWVAVGAVGAGQVRAVAGKELGNMFFALSNQYVHAVGDHGHGSAAVHQPPGLAGRHPQRRQPLHVRAGPGADPAGLAGHLAPAPRLAIPGQRRADVVNVVVAGGFALAGLNPYLNLATAMAGLGTLGIIVLQAAAAAAVVAFFRRRGEMHWWKTVLAPGPRVRRAHRGHRRAADELLHADRHREQRHQRPAVVARGVRDRRDLAMPSGCAAATLPPTPRSATGGTRRLTDPDPAS